MEEKKELKMNLRTMILLIIIFILIVALGVVYYLGFIKDTEKMVNSENTVNVYENGEIGEENKEVEKIDSNKDLVYTDYNNNSFSIPKINMNSQDVISINNEIEKIITEVKKDAQDDVRGMYYGMDYKSYINGEVLSVVINKYSDNDYVDYSIYNVSVKTGKRFTNEELISVKGVPSNEFVNKLPDLYKKKYMEDFNLTENELNSSFHADTYNKTVAKENYGVNEPMFLDGNGNINVVAKIYKPVGGIPPYSEIIIVK